MVTKLKLKASCYHWPQVYTFSSAMIIPVELAFTSCQHAHKPQHASEEYNKISWNQQAWIWNRWNWSPWWRWHMFISWFSLLLKTWCTQEGTRVVFAQCEELTFQSAGKPNKLSADESHRHTRTAEQLPLVRFAAARHVVFVFGMNLQSVLLCKLFFRGMAVALLFAVVQVYTVTGLFFTDFIYEEQFSVIHYEQKWAFKNLCCCVTFWMHIYLDRGMCQCQ